MRYLSDRSKTRRKYINTGLGFIAFTLFVYYWPILRVITYPIIEPLMRGYGSTKIVTEVVPESISAYFSSHKELADRNSDLEITIERLENQLAEKEALLREQSLLSGAETKGQTTPVVVMYPIAKDITSLYSTILLSKGYRDGIEKGGMVYVRGLQPVCEITEVYDRTSLCELLSKGNRITEGVTSSSSVALSLDGMGGGNFTAVAPKGTQVLVGESVYLRGNQSFMLGTVIAVKEDEQATGAKIYVRGAYNPVTSSVFYLNAHYAP